MFSSLSRTHSPAIEKGGNRREGGGKGRDGKERKRREGEQQKEGIIWEVRERKENGEEKKRERLFLIEVTWPGTSSRGSSSQEQEQQ